MKKTDAKKAVKEVRKINNYMNKSEFNSISNEVILDLIEREGAIFVSLKSGPPLKITRAEVQ